MHVCVRRSTVRHNDVSNFWVVPRTIKTLVSTALWGIQYINVVQPKIVLCAFELFEYSNGSKLVPRALRSIMRDPNTCFLHRGSLKPPLWAFFLAIPREEERCIVTFIRTAVVGTVPLSCCCCAQHAFGATTLAADTANRETATLADIATPWFAEAAGSQLACFEVGMNALIKGQEYHKQQQQ